MKQIVSMIVLVLLAVPGIAAESISPEEARLLQEIKATSGEEQDFALMSLASVREQQGKFQAAMDTWGHLKRIHGKERAWNESSAPDHTWADLASFNIQRIKRIQNLQANPPKPLSHDLRKQLGQAQDKISLPLGEAGYEQYFTPVDMDGDLIPEVFVVGGERGQLGEPAKMVLVVLKWNGKQYRKAFQWSGDYKLGIPDQPRFEVSDRGRFGMHAIKVGFDPETDNAARIQSNGQEIIFAY